MPRASRPHFVPEIMSKIPETQMQALDDIPSPKFKIAGLQRDFPPHS